MPRGALCSPSKDTLTILQKKAEKEYRLSRQRNVERCVVLLEHVGNCVPSKDCPEGGACLRLRIVLQHHQNCRAKLQCCVCTQLRQLCHLHSLHCKNNNEDCKVCYCHNGKQHIRLACASNCRPSDDSTAVNLVEQEQMQLLESLKHFSKMGNRAETRHIMNHNIARQTAVLMSSPVKARTWNNLPSRHIRAAYHQEHSRVCGHSILDTEVCKNKCKWNAKLTVFSLKKK